MSTYPSLQLPDSAPFSAEQRQWLNGLLAGLFRNEPVAVSGSSLQVSVFFASQGGTAERLAKKMAKVLKAAGHTATAHTVEHLTPAALAQVQHAVFFASTYGEGEPPDSARAFFSALLAEGAQRLDTVRYSVFCLGDHSYEQFCRFGVDLDERLLALGAQRLQARFECGLEVDAPFASWTKQVIATLQNSAITEVTTSSSPVLMPETNQVHTRENPFHAELVDRRLLTHASSSKQTMHFAFDLGAGEITYEAGDACGVIAQNDPALVEQLLAATHFAETDTVQIPKVGDVSVRDALLHYLQPTRLTRKAIVAFAEKAGCGTLDALLEPQAASHLDAYLHGRDLIDLLQTYPGVLTKPSDLVEILPRLAPRLYSISSSPGAHGRELHCTIAVVRYNAQERERGGVASTMLSDRTAVGSNLPIYIQPNPRFRLPADSSGPMIMIGPGTGIAPFRAFLHERRALGHTGPNWLFFGERSGATDFLYRDELNAFADDGHLRLSTAFSRDQEHKVYVQDRMMEHGEEFFRWLQEGASVYVCGDASRMAKDVDAALHRIVEQHGGLPADAAQEYVSELNDAHRYHRDVY